MRITWCGRSSVLLCLIVAPQLVTALTRFQSWFPRYRSALNDVVANNCSSEYAAWNRGSLMTDEVIGDLLIWDETSDAGPLINCILDATPELIKGTFASAAVLLGLMPGLLAILGPSIQETSTLLALGDRPLLALIICIGSPLIGLDRQLHIRGAFRSLQSESFDLGLGRSVWLSRAQYLIALAAIANTAELTWELAIRVSFSWFQDDNWLLAIWAFIGFAVHILGAITLGTSICMDQNMGGTGALSPSAMSRWLRWRFSFARRDTPVHVAIQPQSVTNIFLVAFITLLTLCQIVFGTIIFSGVLFISVGDAVGVFFRFLASVIACRVLILMELNLLQEAVDMKDVEKGQRIG